MMEIENKESTLIDYVNSKREEGVPEKDLYIYAERYLEFKARKNYIPLHGNFELTPFCNFNCKMCYIHLSKKQYSEDKLLPVEKWKHLMKQAYDAGMRNALLTGGECLTYPGFFELYLFLEEMHVNISVFSNGFLLDSGIIHFFENHKPKLIQVSLYGGSEEEYVSVTGKRGFSKVYQNLKLMKNAGLPVRIAITPNEYMEKNPYKLVSIIKNLKIPYRVNPGLINPRNNTCRNKCSYDLNDYISLLKLLRETKNGNKDYEIIDPIELPETGNLNSSVINKTGLLCGGGKSSFTIKYDGFMCPCISLDDYCSNAMELGFLESWHRINEYAMNYLMPIECTKCAYIESCKFCPAFHKDGEKGHCNRAICEQTKKLVSSGILALPIEYKK